VIDIQFCGICHSDIHQARNEWSNALYPMVPGHEIVYCPEIGQRRESLDLGSLRCSNIYI
jgi:uncharacterized zinc-type alcohol dehydrogenase-like protein